MNKIGSGPTLAKIQHIQWGALTGDQWLRYSVVDITLPSPKDITMSKDDETDPRLNTPYDPRLGEQRDRVPCATCNQYNITCPGHFGTIRLPFPIYNRSFTPILIKILQCVCRHCSRPRILPSHIDIQGFSKLNDFQRVKALAEKCNKSVKVCPWDDCGEPMTYFSLPIKKRNETGGVVFYTVGGKKGNREAFSSTDAYNMVSRISSEHLQILGFNSKLLKHPEYTNPDYFIDENQQHVHEFRPEACFYTVVPVLPTLARSFVQDDDGIKDDDLTVKYNELLKSITMYNTFVALEDENYENGVQKKNTISTRRGRVKTKADVERDIMDHVWTIIDNKDEAKKITNGNRTHRCIKKRISGKDGRIQQNVCGKRTDYSARTVIVGGGYRLENDELGIPEEIAKIETKPMFVGPWNIEECQKLVSEGKVNRVVRKTMGKDGKFFQDKKKLQELPDKGVTYPLKIGDTIHRHLRDGDIVYFNRQPTLRVESMTAFRAKIVEGMAFMLGLCWTKAFNADFDSKRSKTGGLKRVKPPSYFLLKRTILVI
jgi:DNA-directed RNA polymerase beta' subunit